MLDVHVASMEEIAAFRLCRHDGETVAKIAYLDGKPIALGGITWTRIGAMLWLEIKPEAKRFKTGLHRAALELIRAAWAAGEKRLVAFQNPLEPRADMWLRRLGFHEAPTMVKGMRMFVVEAGHERA